MHKRPRLLLEIVFSAVPAAFIWWFLRPPYEASVTWLANLIFRLVPQSDVAELVYADGTARIVSGGTTHSIGGTITLPYITMNLIVFWTLAVFSMLRTRELQPRRTLAATAAIAVTHAIALAISAYAVLMLTEVNAGRRTIGLLENLEFAFYQGYTVIFAAAIAFATWWIAFPSAEREIRRDRA